MAIIIVCMYTYVCVCEREREREPTNLEASNQECSYDSEETKEEGDTVKQLDPGRTVAIVTLDVTIANPQNDKC